MADKKVIFFIILQFFLFKIISSDGPKWEYKCIKNNCRRTEITSNKTIGQSLGACQLLCGQGSLWPPPLDRFDMSQELVNLDLEKTRYFSRSNDSPVNILIRRKIMDLQSHFQRFKTEDNRNAKKRYLRIVVRGIRNHSDTSLTLETDESYRLTLNTRLAATRVEIQAENYFGVRHALTTLEQLIFFNDVIKQIQVPRDVWIIDKPNYPYRGVMLDTSRTYIQKSAIMRTIEGMGMSKLNTLHWHITDQHSFPYVSRSWPNMSQYGAYSASKVYTSEDIQEIKEFGTYHGVRVVPELDAPAHVSEGWQWLGDALLCYRQLDWQNYCSGPPCGQLNPLSEKVYEVLEGLYRDMLADFGGDLFHMGGDQVNHNCWQSSDKIRRWANSTNLMLKDEKFVLLWNFFQERAYEKLKAANGGKDQQVIIWASELTKKANLGKFDNKTHIIQNWHGKNDGQSVADWVNAGFRVIFSNYDVHYLDCGFGSYMGMGNNWCSPYIGWKEIWAHSPAEILENLGLESKKNLIFGGEVILWTESVDDQTLDVRLWPRAAALAGRLWNDEETSQWKYTWKDVEYQMFYHRDRLVARGISAQPMAPEWCQQNLGLCRLPEKYGSDTEYVIIFPS